MISAYATVSHLLRQMEEAGGEGRSPTGVGAPLTPLPPDELAVICEPLRALRTRLHAYAAELAPDELAALERPQGRLNTRVWLSNLLEKIRYAVDSLRPDQMRKYGARGETQNSDALATLHDEMLECVVQARQALDRKGMGR